MKNEVNKNDATNLDLELLQKTGEPHLYQVYLHNDDFTPMEFVVDLLEKHFFMDRRRAAKTMLDAHQNGKATCGVFTRDVAETKIAQVLESARMYEYPLTCSMEAA
jgi:ATP-dependent Clp protease adaptor protein ClpS